MLTSDNNVFGILPAFEPVEERERDLALLGPELVELRGEQADLLSEEADVLGGLGACDLNVRGNLSSK